MSTTVEAPIEFVETLKELRLPGYADARLQALMDRNTEGALSSEEQDELAALAEWSERLSLVRAEAYRLLRQRP